MTVFSLGATPRSPFRAEILIAFTPAVANAIPLYPIAQGVLDTSATTSLDPLWSIEPILYSRVPLSTTSRKSSETRSLTWCCTRET